MNTLYPSSLFFIAADKESFNFITQLNGRCLLGEKFLDIQKLSLYYQQEVWILYAIPQHFTRAMQLARLVQLAGSDKTLVILIKR